MDWKTISRLFTLVGLLGFVYIFLALLFEPAWLTYPRLPHKTLMQTVVAGNPIKLYVYRCNSSTDLRSYQISREIVCDDKHTVVLAADSIAIGPGCTEGISLANVIPADTDSAKGCYVQGTSEVLGTIRTRIVPWYSDKFDIVAAPVDTP